MTERQQLLPRHHLIHLRQKLLSLGLLFLSRPCQTRKRYLLLQSVSSSIIIIAIPAVVTDSSVARMLVLAFNVEGTVDLIAAIVLANVNGVAPYMGPAYWIPAFWVPALLVTHYVTFLVLRHHWNAADWQAEARL
jgi:hypothetical protein